MFRKSNQLLSFFMVLSAMQPVLASKQSPGYQVKLGYMMSECLYILCPETVANKDDIKSKIEKEIKGKKVYTEGKNLAIYLLLPRKSNNSSVEVLEPLDRVKEIKNGQEYIYRTALKMVYEKDGSKEVSFVGLLRTGELERLSVGSYFCEENGINWPDMEDDGEGGFIDKKIKKREKRRKLLWFILISMVVLGGVALLFWAFQQDKGTQHN